MGGLIILLAWYFKVFLFFRYQSSIYLLNKNNCIIVLLFYKEDMELSISDRYGHYNNMSYTSPHAVMKM